MRGVEFGFTRIDEREHLSFDAQPMSWFFFVSKGSMKVITQDATPFIVEQGSCFGIDGRKPFKLAEISRNEIPSKHRTFTDLETYDEQNDKPLVLLTGHVPITANLLLSSFSEQVHVNANAPGTIPQTIKSLAHLIETEISTDIVNIDRNGVLKRLAELLVLTLVRHMVQIDPSMQTLLPTAISDTRIWRALSAFHRTMDFEWTVEDLAKVAGMSRTSFAVRFNEIVKTPPLQCLTQIRMKKAASLLSRGDMPIKSIAESIGYKGESSFNRAFVRHTGVTPGKWRKNHR